MTIIVKSENKRGFRQTQSAEDNTTSLLCRYVCYQSDNVSRLLLSFYHQGENLHQNAQRVFGVRSIFIVLVNAVILWLCLDRCTTNTIQSTERADRCATAGLTGSPVTSATSCSC